MSRPARRVGSTILTIAFVVVSLVLPKAPPATAAPTSQRVLVVSDSVGLSAKTAIPDAFPADWEVNVVGTPAMFVEQLENSHVKPQIALSPWNVGDHVVIAGGYNYPFWDPERFDRSIDSMITTLTAAGVAHIYWVTLREVQPWFVSPSGWRDVQPYYWYFPTVNEHLERALLRHPNLTLIDWAAAASRPGITYDAIHLNPTGAALYSGLIADAVHNAESRVPNRSVTRVSIPETVAGDAVVLNLTATGTRRDGYFSAYSCDDDRPLVSNLNHGRDHTVAASAIVPIGPSREICIYNESAAQVIVDLFGRYTGGADLADAPPRRLLDTRDTSTIQRVGVTRAVQIVGPNAAAAGTRTVALNLTAVGSSRSGYVTVHPCGSVIPVTSNVNFRPGAAVPNAVISEPDSNGMICLTTSADSHIVLDLFASFGPDSDLGLSGPFRVLDTREVGPIPPARSIRRIPAADLTPLGVSGDESLIFNLTITEARQRGFATAYGCNDGLPATSNINYSPGQTVANMVTVQPDADGDVCIYTEQSTHIVVDALGHTGSSYHAVTPRRLFDSRN